MPAILMLIALAAASWITALVIWLWLPKAWTEQAPNLTAAVSLPLGPLVFGVLGVPAAMAGLTEPQLISVAVFATALIIGLVVNRDRLALLKCRLAAWPTDLLLIGALIIYAVIFAYNAGFSVASERAIDLSLLFQVMRDPVWPPLDPWLSGYAANYYHFFFWMWGMLARLFSTDAMLAALPVAVWTWAMAVPLVAVPVAVASRRLWAGALAIVTTMFIGHFHKAWELLNGFGFDVHTRTLPGAAWFSSARAIEGAITETPAFATFFGDPHPYVLAIPLTLAALAILLLRRMSRTPETAPLAMISGVWLGLILGGLWTGNSWSTLAVGGCIAAVLASDLIISPRKAFKPVLWLAACSTAVAVAIAALTMGGYEQSSRSVGIVLAPSQPLELFRVYGPVLVISIIALAFAAPLLDARRRLPFLGTAVVTLMLGITYGPAQPMAVLVASLAFAVTIKDAPAVIRFGLVLVLSSSAGYLICEYFFVDDYYGIQWYRANTIFKVHMNTWLIGMIGAWIVIASRWATTSRALRAAALFLTAGVCIGGGVFTYVALTDRIGNPTGPMGLELRLLNDHRQIAADMLRQVPGRPVVLEAQTSGSYSYEGQAIMASGHRGYAVWPSQQLGWREHTDATAEAIRRLDLVREIYDGVEADDLRQIADDEGIDLMVMTRDDFVDMGSEADAHFDALLESFPVVAATENVALLDLRPAMDEPITAETAE